MKKLFLMFIMCLFSTLAFANTRADNRAEVLIEKYVSDPMPTDTYDWISKYYFQIADLGYVATPALLKALKNIDPRYAEEKLAFIYLLGMIGDPVAYEDLYNYFQETEKEKIAKWRAAISLGSCLTKENVFEFLYLLLNDETEGGLLALQEMSGEGFSQDKGLWLEWLSRDENLVAFRKNCKQRSGPILG